MNEDFSARAGRLLSEYSGGNVGIVQIKYLVDILLFCKNVDKTYKMPVPPKDLSKEWTFNDWCDYVDATWARKESENAST